MTNVIGKYYSQANNLQINYPERGGKRIGITAVSLNSGSNGNATIVRSESTTLLIDAGLNGKLTSHRMREAGLDIQDIDAILITHEHSDHIGGAGVLARRLKVPLYMTGMTGKGMILKEIILRGLNQKEVNLGGMEREEISEYFPEMRLGRIPDSRFFEANDPFKIGDFNIQPFSISHDAVDPVGFLIESNGIRVGICTDLGVVPHYIKMILHDAHILFFESNHDVRMLEYGPYTPALKNRVKGNLGHLSNMDAAKALLDIIGDRTEHILLSHLSGNNNTPAKAYHTVRGILREFHLFPAVHLTRRDGISEIVSIESP